MIKNMTAVLIGLLSIGSLSAKVNTDGVYLLNMGIPLVYPSNCSAFVINHPHREKPVGVTAYHCTNRGFSNPETFTSLMGKFGQVMGVADSLVTSPFRLGDTEDKEFNKGLDIYMATADTLKKDIFAYELAAERPKNGDVLYAIGFPVRTVPLTVAGAIKVKHKCIYQGETFQNSALHDGRLSYTNLMHCDNILGSGGMSGGAIVNSKNEIVGVLTNELSNSMIKSSNVARLYFTEITKDTLSETSRDKLIYKNNKTKVIKEFVGEYFKTITKRKSSSGRINGPKTRSVKEHHYDNTVIFPKVEVDLVDNIISGELKTTKAGNNKIVIELFEDGFPVKENN